MTRTATLGLGGTIDFELHWNAATLASLAAELGVVDLTGEVPGAIDSERALVVSILEHMRRGTGGEYFVGSSAVIEGFAARFGYRTTLGGTPVRAALAMSTLGMASTVHLVSTNEHVRRLLPADVHAICSAEEDSLDPHLIVQYPGGARVRVGAGEIVSPGANRLIYPCDRPNAELRLSSELPTALRRTDVLLVSGFNSMQERDLLDVRLAELIDALGNLPPDAVTLYEHAGFHRPEFGRVVLEALAPHVAMISLNEDELMDALARRINLADPRDVEAGVREFAGMVGGRMVVLHTRHFALAHARRARDMAAVLETGIAVSAARYAWGDRATRGDVERLRHTGRRSPVGALVAETLGADDEFCVVPACELEDVATPTTIGLGDTFIGGVVAALVEKGDCGASSTAPAPGVPAPARTSSHP